ncbi:MAG: hypothetical protein IJR67_02810 [Acholeplasmatales bacterium]|nr:hypothetical protein [Acholeplasmatales bacterium]
MNKKTQSIFSLVAGCFAALVALLYLISGIIELTNIGDVGGDATAIIYLILVVIVALCASAGMCFCGVKLILGFTKNDDNPKFVKLLAVVFFGYHVLLRLVLMIFSFDLIGYYGVNFWLPFIVAIIGLVISFIAIFVKFDAKVNPIFNIAVHGFGFIAAIIILAIGSTGLGLAALIFNMLMFAVTITYFIFEILIASNGGSAQPKVEEPKEEEPAKEDSAE